MKNNNNNGKIKLCATILTTVRMSLFLIGSKKKNSM